MLNIVIVGADELGQNIAETLSSLQNNVILVDKDRKKIEDAASKMDVAVKKGTPLDWQLLDDLLDTSPDVFLALTQDDEVNLSACNIAKNLGYPRTIARVKDDRFLNRTRLDFARIFDIDDFVCPEMLVANEIQKYLLSPSSNVVETFAHGAVLLKTLTIPPHWKKGDRTIAELDLPPGVMIGLLKQDSEDGKLIFPHGQDKLKPKDEITCIGETDAILQLHHFFGVVQKPCRSVMIIGGSRIAVNLAQLLEKQKCSVRIVDKDEQVCSKLAEKLPKSTILYQDGTDLDFLRSEKVDQADIFISATTNDETNLMATLVAKEAGATQTIAALSRKDAYELAKKLGISFTVSPILAAKNKLLSLVMSSKLTSIISLYNQSAEVVEIKVSMDSKLVGIPISDLGPLLPSDFLIAVIQNRGRVMIANGNRILSPGDSVIVVTSPRHLTELGKVF